MIKIILSVLLLGNITLTYAQQAGSVGINTANPEKELTVNGTMKTSGMIFKDPIEKLGAAENYSFLIKSPAPENKITSYNNSFVPTTPAPINLIQFKINCHQTNKDWVDEYDTKINAKNFLVVISSFGFTQPLLTIMDRVATPIPQIYAYSKNGTWRLKADYAGFKPDDSLPAGIWTLNLLVFDKAYAKQFSTSQGLNGSATGSAVAPLIQ